MRIGLFTDTYFPQVSGVATSIQTLRDSLVRRGHEVYIFTTTDPQATPSANIIRLKSMPFISFSDRRVAYAGFERALKIARQYELDLIHTQSEFSLGLAGQFIASRLKIPVIHTYHTMYENYTHYILNGRLIYPTHVRMLTRAFCNSVHGVIVPSQLTYDTLLDYGVESPMKIIPTGVDVPPYDQKQRDEWRQEFNFLPQDLVLLSLCRLSKEKQVDQVIDSFAQIKAIHPTAQLVIAGDGPERSNLEAQVAQLALTDVHFVGEVPHAEVSRYYQMADLYLNASQSESQGLTYLEALVNRLPIIARSNGYLQSVMTSESMGALVDSDQSFSQVVLDYLSQTHPPIAAETLTALSSDHFAESVEEFYLTILNNYSASDHLFFEMVTSGIKGAFAEITLATSDQTLDKE